MIAIVGNNKQKMITRSIVKFVPCLIHPPNDRSTKWKVESVNINSVVTLYVWWLNEGGDLIWWTE
jgi:hypothetical protein